MNPEYKLICAPEMELTDEEKEVVKISFDKYGINLTSEQISWRRYAIMHKCGGDLNFFKQEYPLTPDEAFIFSGRPRFDINILKKLKDNAIKPIKTDGILEVYEPFDKNSRYVIGVDTSEGLATGDNSSVSILNCKTYTKAAGYFGKMEPDILATYLTEWGNKYNEALIAVESNNHGLVTIKYLKDKYKNLFSRKIYDKISDVWTEKIGFQTNSRTKPILISALDRALRDGLHVFDAQTIDELMTYIIEEDGTTNASEGKKDDNVISLALAIQAYLETHDHTIPEPKEPILEGSVAHIMQQKKESMKPSHAYQGIRFSR